MRVPRAVVVGWLLGGVLLASGCDKLKAMRDANAPQPPVEQPQVPAEQVARVEAPPQPAAPPRTPEVVISEFLALSPFQRTDAHLQELAALPSGLERITELDLTSSSVSPVGLQEIPKFPELKTLNLTSTRITDSGLAPVGQCAKLQSLIVDNTSLNGSGLAEVVKCPTLVELSFKNSSLADAHLAALGGAEKLEILRLDGNRTLLGNQIGAVLNNDKLRSLKELTVENTQLGTYGLADLGVLKNLEVFHGGSASLGDVTVASLGGCPQLRVAWLHGNTLTNQGVAGLSRCRNLEEVTLAGCRLITDDALDDLRRLTKLKQLDLSGTACTREAVQRLSERFLKETKIVFNGESFGP